jgi:hypothetical protein
MGAGSFLRSGASPTTRHKAAHELGNAPTFDDAQAERYEVPRLAGQEGVFGRQPSPRFKLVPDSRWFYRQSQVGLSVGTK